MGKRARFRDELGEYEISEKSGEKIYIINLGDPNIVAAIEEVVTNHGISYSKLAAAMGVSRMSVHMVRTGKRHPSRKFVAKFDAARRLIELGKVPLRARQRWDQNLLVFAVNADLPVDDASVSTDEVTLKTRGQNDPSESVGKRVKLAPPSIGRGLQIIRKALVENNCDDLLVACLPSPYNSPDWVERLSASSYLQTVKKCVVAILGSSWQDDLRKIIEATEKQHAAGVVQGVLQPEPAKSA